jgi:hypothetical protein
MQNYTETYAVHLQTLHQLIISTQLSAESVHVLLNVSQLESVSRGNDQARPNPSINATHVLQTCVEINMNHRKETLRKKKTQKFKHAQHVHVDLNSPSRPAVVFGAAKEAYTQKSQPCTW